MAFEEPPHKIILIPNAFFFFLCFCVVFITDHVSYGIVSIDIQLAEIEIPAALNMVKGVQPACQVREYVSAAKIESLASSLIKESMAGTKVVIFCGWRAYPFGEEIEKIAAFLEIPIVTSFDAKGTVNEDHSRSFGVAGMYGFVGGEFYAFFLIIQYMMILLTNCTLD